MCYKKLNKIRYKKHYKMRKKKRHKKCYKMIYKNDTRYIAQWLKLNDSKFPNDRVVGF